MFGKKAKTPRKTQSEIIEETVLHIIGKGVKLNWGTVEPIYDADVAFGSKHFLEKAVQDTTEYVIYELREGVSISRLYQLVDDYFAKQNLVSRVTEAAFMDILVAKRNSLLVKLYQANLDKDSAYLVVEIMEEKEVHRFDSLESRIDSTIAKHNRSLNRSLARV